MKSKKGAAPVEEGEDDAVDLFADDFNDGARAKKEKRARGVSEDIGSKVEVEVQKAEEKMERISAAFRAKFEEDVGRGRGKVSPCEPFSLSGCHPGSQATYLGSDRVDFRNVTNCLVDSSLQRSWTLSRSRLMAPKSRSTRSPPSASRETH